MLLLRFGSFATEQRTLRLTLITEGASEVMLRFKMLLKSFCNKNICFINKTVFFNNAESLKQ